MQYNQCLFEPRHAVTYYYANMISNIMNNQMAYIRSLHDFWGDEFSLDLSPFKKKSIFHSFIFYIISSCIDEGISEERLEHFKREKDFRKSYFSTEPVFLTDIEYYANCYGYKLETAWEFADKKLVDLTIDDVSDYFYELPLYCEEYEHIIWLITREIFYILFPNRELLWKFNDMISKVISDLATTEIDASQAKYFQKDGVLRRKKIPEWAKKAVFFRDKGLCVNCNKDITGLISNINNIHIDHIVPLSAGGLNDISNLQLLCSECNIKKSDSHAYTNNRVSDWYNWNIEKEI